MKHEYIFVNKKHQLAKRNILGKINISTSYIIKALNKTSHNFKNRNYRLFNLTQNKILWINNYLLKHQIYINNLELITPNKDYLNFWHKIIINNINPNQNRNYQQGLHSLLTSLCNFQHNDNKLNCNLLLLEQKKHNQIKPMIHEIEWINKNKDIKIIIKNNCFIIETNNENGFKINNLIKYLNYLQKNKII